MAAVVIIQGTIATIASMTVGYLWHSELMFARTWWRHNFPGKAFEKATNHPQHLPLFATIIKNAILIFVVNSIYPLVADKSPECAGLMFPLTLGLIVSGVSACLAFPHHVYSRKPFTLYLISTGIGVGMILKLGGLKHGEHVRSGTLSIISHFKDYVHKN